MMRIDILTLFPQMCQSVLEESIIGRACKNDLVSIHCHNIRDFAHDKHHRADDAPYGGGMGMVMLAEPIALCFEHVCNVIGEKPYFIYMSAQGKVLTQKKSCTLSHIKNLCILCGHYEGVDERVIDELVDEEISIGDFVLTGGELPALVLVDTIVRLLPGVLSDTVCFEEESHYNGLLEYPQYTRPAVWRGHEVPEVLLSGHHANIKNWRSEQSFLKTQKNRIDLWEKFHGECCNHDDKKNR